MHVPRNLARLTRRTAVLASAAGLIALGMSAATPLPAAAVINQSGMSCSGTVAGIAFPASSDDVGGQPGNPIRLKASDTVHVQMTAPGAKLTHVVVQLGFFGDPSGNGAAASVPVADAANPDNPYNNDISVGNYASHGIGIYTVVVALSAQGASCLGAAYVDVTGNPLDTDAGKAAAVAEGVGLAGVLIAGAAGAAGSTSPSPPSPPAPAAPSGEDAEDGFWDNLEDAAHFFGCCGFFVLPALFLTLFSMATPAPAGAPPPRPPIRLKRARWRPKLSFVGIVGGLLMGIGGIVLLQQYGVVYPTITSTATLVAGGLLVGVAVPSLTRLVALARVNGQIARLEAAANARRAGRA